MFQLIWIWPLAIVPCWLWKVKIMTKSTKCVISGKYSILFFNPQRCKLWTYPYSVKNYCVYIIKTFLGIAINGLLNFHSIKSKAVTRHLPVPDSDLRKPFEKKKEMVFGWKKYTTLWSTLTSTVVENHNKRYKIINSGWYLTIFMTTRQIKPTLKYSQTRFNQVIFVIN